MKEQLSKLFGLNDTKTMTSTNEEVQLISLHDIVTSPFQPRTVFDDERIEELCQTIRTHGVIQPIVVRVRNDKYEIIAGERRYRAVTKLGHESIPAIVREFNDSQTASIALIENLQRENLTAIEEAVAYQRLLELHTLTQESLAQRLGKSQSTIANKLRLLALPEEIKTTLMEKKISERHARALLSLDEAEQQLQVMQEIIKNEWNVKQTETRIAFLKGLSDKKKPSRISFTKDVRLALNTIRQSVKMVSGSGMDIKTEESDHEDHYEIVIKIPKKSK